ncbi:proline racemase family protein [Labrenzia sp. 011]|uniref:proline racemase family protein n=1 Tax=Labrenzia sp. 011 TaxID=2171494 RepID=UPI000D51ECAC|nr:proline racemase family protein [Labrenzia sp. 011]PVB62310.1 hypothetical protein DCO57_08420 [Labrenzia sp. 011]
MSTTRRLTTVDSHTAGHPTRVITGGVPPLEGDTVSEKYAWFQDNLDELRPLLLHEPRGHSAMVGAVMTGSQVADFGAFFLGSYNYLPMCGHATIGLAATLDYLGLVSPDENGRAAFSLEVPAGIVDLALTYDGNRLISASFANVPAFVAAQNVRIPALEMPLTCDIAYGGNWYALVEADAAGVSLEPSGVTAALALGSRIKAEINALIDLGRIPNAGEHVHSVLFYRTSREAGLLVSRQLVVLAANKFDRSPCGTGTSARLAQLIGLGEISSGERIRSRNILDVDFSALARPLEQAGPGAAPMYRPYIEGLAHITGQHTFIRTENDPLPIGFLCR